MSTGIEVVQIVDRWLWETFTGDATLMTATGGRITTDEYPEEWPNPLLTYQMSSSRDILGVGGERISTNNLYEIKAVDQGSTYQRITPIAARVDTLLHKARVSTAYGNLTCQREFAIRYPESRQGVRYRHLGAMYRILADS
jgi:hypothetical protein